MRKSAPIEVVVHYPKTEEGWKELGKRVAKAGFKNHRENKGCRLRAAYISSCTMGFGVVY